METIKLQIENIRNIENFTIELPLEKGLFAITGENGIGKSTIFSVLSKLVYKKALNKFLSEDGNSSSKLTYWQGNKKNIWIKFGKGEHSHWKRKKPYGEDDEEISINGSFEAGVLFGSRFNNVHKSALNIFLDKSDNTTEDELVKVLDEADDFLKDNLGLILQNDSKYYSSLKRLSYEPPDLRSKQRKVWIKYHDFPYFLKIKDKFISYIFLSSGELLMIGLLDFINTTIARNLRKSGGAEKYLILIDEIELALHSAAQARLADFLLKISSEYNFVIYFSTHSIPIINHISPSNIFHLYRNAGELGCLNPCYPEYATRNLYTNNGFDYLILVEDELAKLVVESIIDRYSLGYNKMINVFPSGGWRETLALQNKFDLSKIAGSSCHIFSILDGDIEDDCNRAYPKGTPYNKLVKIFLPIKSLEKTLKQYLIDSPDPTFCKEFGDRLFRYESLDSIISDYKKKQDSQGDNNGKNLYRKLKKCAEMQEISNEAFQHKSCKFIYEKINFVEIENILKCKLT